MVTLVFTTSTSLLSKAIRAFTGGPTSHVAIGTEFFGVPVLIHAALDNDVSGVQITTREKWLVANSLVAEYEILPDVTNNMRSMIMLLGEKYDKLGLIGYVLVAVAKWFGKWIKNPLASPRAWVCPRYVLGLDPECALIPEWKNIDRDSVTPKDLLEACQSENSFRVLSSPS